MRLVVALICVAFALPARADNEAAALEHLDKGVAAFRAGDYAFAHGELTLARDLAPAKPNPYRWLALTEVQLGDCPHALGNIESFLARVRDDDSRIGEMTRLRELCKRGANLTLDHDIAQPAPDPMFTTTPEPAPGVTHRWWFWPAIGAAALAVTGATIYLVTHDGESTLPPIHCATAGCMP
jgi:hypothetical protein